MNRNLKYGNGTGKCQGEGHEKINHDVMVDPCSLEEMS
jgi:hypothetical protein